MHIYFLSLSAERVLKQRYPSSKANLAFSNTIIKVKKPVILREISYSKFGVGDMQDSMMWHQKVKKSTYPLPPQIRTYNYRGMSKRHSSQLKEFPIATAKKCKNIK